MGKFRGVTLTALLLSLAACGKPATEGFSAGQFRVEVSNDGERYAIRHGDRVLLRSAIVAAEALHFEGSADMAFGRFTFSQEITRTTAFGDPEVRGRQIALDRGKLLLSPTAEGKLLRVTVEARGVKADGWRLAFDCAPHQDFLGFGQQYSYIAMKGRRVPLWSEENGLGRTEKAFPPLGTLFSSYYPVPYFLDPRGMGFIADSSAYQVFSMCENGSSTWSVEVWDTQPFTFYVLAGPRPIDVVAQLTTVTGRPRMLPDWGFDLWLSAQGGPQAVRDVMRKAADAGIPYSTLWVQDWVGRREFSSGLFGVKYRWSLDETFYPDFTTLIADIHADGKKFLGYFNPFILPDFEFYEVGKENGYLIKDAAGDPYLFTVSVFDGSLVDMTNPDAVKWFKGYARKAVALGIDGWMSDFGEWLPWDAVLHAGSAPLVHNLYPTLWHQASRDVLDEMRPDGDYVLLTRSGHLREAGVAQVVWVGDQEASWNEHDGLPTAVRAIISLALSGVPYVTHDIAGFSGGPSDKELWMRWVEFGAFTPIMRLHDGLKKYENWTFYADPESSAFLARFSKIHSLLKPYLKSLAAQAVAEGLPIVRHYALVDGRPATWGVEDAYFLGPDLLVAPVTRRGSGTRVVDLPPGTWRAIFGQGSFKGPVRVSVAAPIGRPAVFAREGSEVDSSLTDLP